MTRTSFWAGIAIRRVAFVLGAVLLLTGVAINARAAITRGEDFDSLYVIARALALGINAYAAPDLPALFSQMKDIESGAPWGLFYPPSLAAVMLPLSWLPFGVAKASWTVAIAVVLFAGLHELLRLVTPRMPLGYRVLILGALSVSAAVRWGFISLQAAPLLFGLLGLYLAAQHANRRSAMLVILVLVVCLKFTLALPFLGLAWLQRRYGLLAAAAVVFVAANALGFTRMGGLEAITGYQANMVRLEAPDQLNYPDFRLPNSMQRLDWPYIVMAISPDLARANMLGMLLTGLSGVWLAWQWWQSRRFDRDLEISLAFLGPLVCLSLLSLYHHHYDAIALFAPVLVYLARWNKDDRALILAFTVAVVIFAGLYQVGTTQELLERFFGVGPASLIKLLGVVAVNIAFGASLMLLQRFVARRRAAMAREHHATEASAQTPALTPA
jgi:Glycosyltransferase family 87